MGNANVLKTFFEVARDVVGKVVSVSEAVFQSLTLPLIAPLGEDSFLEGILHYFGIEDTIIVDILTYWSGGLFGLIIGDMNILELTFGIGLVFAVVWGIVKFFK